MKKQEPAHKGRSRAFIAAPLLGTLIFLIAVVYCVNLVKNEADSVSQISDDAYHNRLASMLELYRSDLLGFFSDGLSQNTEDFLASASWGGLNTVRSFSSTQREQTCNALSKYIQSTLTNSGANTDSTYLSGFSDLLNALRKPLTFEGMTFSPVTFAPFKSETGQTVTDQFDCLSANSVCQKLLPGIDFDCKNYGSNLAHPYQCNYSGSVLPGCEDGQFYMTINLSDKDVYQAMPRIQISDSFGNTIRTSVLGTESFPVLVTYPLFRYNDASFRMFAINQYFNGAGVSMVSRSNAPAQAPSTPPLDYLPYLNSFSTACQYIHTNFKGFGFDAAIQDNGVNVIDIKCPQSGNYPGGLTNAINLYNGFLANGGKDVNPISECNFKIQIIDYNPEFQVNKLTPNSYSVGHIYNWFAGAYSCG
jgi:hypothetical protein